MLRGMLLVVAVVTVSCAEDRPRVASDDGDGGAARAAGAASSGGTLVSTAQRSRYACGCIVPAGIVTADLRCGEALCAFGETHTCADDMKTVTTPGETCSAPDEDAGVGILDAGREAGPNR